MHDSLVCKLFLTYVPLNFSPLSPSIHEKPKERYGTKEREMRLRDKKEDTSMICITVQYRDIICSELTYIHDNVLLSV